MSDTVGRTVYGRIFAGTLDEESDATAGALRAQLFDRLTMPSLYVDTGKTISYDLTLDTTGGVLTLPPNYDDDNRLYVALTTDVEIKIITVSPTHGTNSVLVMGTTGSTDGEHAGFYCWQGDVTSITIVSLVAATLSVFMYEIPDLTDQDSYVGGSLALGTGTVV